MTFINSERTASPDVLAVVDGGGAAVTDGGGMVTVLVDVCATGAWLPHPAKRTAIVSDMSNAVNLPMNGSVRHGG